MAENFPTDFPEVTELADDAMIPIYQGGRKKLRASNLPAGSGGVPDDGSVTAAKITEAAGELSAIRTKIGAASATDLADVDDTVDALSGSVTTQGATITSLQSALVSMSSDIAGLTNAVASGIAAPYDTWAELEAVVPTVADERADVIPSDTGTHTDPVTGATVSNNGVFRSQDVSGTLKWRRVYDYGAVTQTEVEGWIDPLIAPVAADATEALAYKDKLTADQGATFDALFVNPGYINLSGAYVANASWHCTALIELSTIKVLRIKLAMSTAASSVAFYDAGKNFISGVHASTTGEVLETFPEVPSGAVYVRFSEFTPQRASEEFVAISSFSSEIPALTLDFVGLGETTGYIKTDGTQTTTAGWVSTDFLELPVGMEITCRLFGHTVVRSVAFYDAAKAYLSGYSAASAGGTFASTVTVPTGTKYTRFSYGVPGGAANAPADYVNSAVASTSLSELVSEGYLPDQTFDVPVFRAPQRIDLGAEDSVLLYGDSISSTLYPWYAERMAALTGATVTRGGFSGYTTAQLAADAQYNTIAASGAKLIVALLGANDSGAPGTVGTFGAIPGEPVVAETSIAANYAGTTFIQAVSHIIRRLVADYDNVRERADLTGSETESEKQAKIDAVLKPMIAIATPLPEQRDDAANAFSKPENWKRKRDAIVECCARYKVHCVDLQTMLRIDMSIEPYYVAPTDTTTNNGNLFMDGVHPNKTLSHRMAEVICADLGVGA